MTSDEIIAAVRRAIREPSKKTVKDSDIIETYTLGIYEFAKRIKSYQPDYHAVRKSVASNTNSFNWPDDAVSIMNVWDLDNNAGDVTGAADNGSGLIRITCTDHGFSTGDIITVHDVGGTTEANDVWQVTDIDDDNFDLIGSTFTNTYTSGGKCYKEPSDMDRLTKIDVKESSGANDGRYYLRGRTIVVDDLAFTDDIVIDYVKLASALTDIPTEYHYGLVSFSVKDRIRMPDPDDPGYADKLAVLQYHDLMLMATFKSIQETFEMDLGPMNIGDEGEHNLE